MIGHYLYSSFCISTIPKQQNSSPNITSPSTPLHSFVYLYFHFFLFLWGHFPTSRGLDCFMAQSSPLFLLLFFVIQPLNCAAAPHLNNFRFTIAVYKVWSFFVDCLYFFPTGSILGILLFSVNNSKKLVAVFSDTFSFALDQAFWWKLLLVNGFSLLQVEKVPSLSLSKFVVS